MCVVFTNEGGNQRELSAIYSRVRNKRNALTRSNNFHVNLFLMEYLIFNYFIWTTLTKQNNIITLPFQLFFVYKQIIYFNLKTIVSCFLFISFAFKHKRALEVTIKKLCWNIKISYNYKSQNIILKITRLLIEKFQIPKSKNCLLLLLLLFFFNKWKSLIRF